MNLNRTPLALALAAVLLSACSKAPEAPKPTAADADAFVARANDTFRADYPESTSAQWLASTYINSDSQRVSAGANERSLAKLGEFVRESKQFDDVEMGGESQRAIQLMRLAPSMPPPADPQKLAELTRIATKLEGE